MFKYAASLLVLGFATISVAIPRGVGINVRDYFEQRCRPDKGFITKSFEDWMGNLTLGTPLYFPLMSNLDLLRLTQDLFRQSDLSFLTKDQVLNSCITMESDGAHLTFNGYCGQSFNKDLIPVVPKVFKWKKLFLGGVGGSFRISLSDSKSWQVVDVCWGDGQRSFAVISLYPTLSPCTLKTIVEHVKAIGFQQQFFSGLKYDQVTCACQQGQTSLELEDPYSTYEGYY